MHNLVRYLIICNVLISLPYCKSKEETIIEPEIVTTGDNTTQYAKNSIVGLHANIFAPTCANSGCHDGAFPPDFRTIESTYNTLVMHPIVKNNATNDYTYRVVPGDADNSILYRRMIEDIDGQSGIMPLYSGASWDAVKQEHINNIVSWINNGAPDIFGNPYVEGNQNPQMQGFVATPTGSNTPLSRNPSEQILIPSNLSNITLWFSFKDDATAPNDFGTNILKLSEEVYDFENSSELNLNTNQSITASNYFGNEQVTYTHSLDIDPSVFEIDKSIFARVYVDDGDGDTEIPSNGSPDYIKFYFSLKRIQ